MVEPSPATAAVTPIDEILFHVRVIDPWRSSPSLPQQARWSFFGLELALCGRRSNAPHVDETAKQVLDFSATARPGQRETLRGVVAPFTVTVASKMPLDAASDHQKTLLQLFVPVQTHNTLARINKIHFLKHCTTGADVFHALERVLDAVSVAKPFELTFLRHNHAQAAAKIRPFAARADVQKAQVAQFQKLQADELQWPIERKRRKQFVLQQMDFYRERYLYDHIGSQLQSLHEEIMGGGQWHAYEFEKVLWYYHAPTGRLYAEHPMRNNEKTRQLIGGVQLRTRTAAKQLQHGVRRFLRVCRVANQAVTQVIDTVADDILKTTFDMAWEARITAPYVDQLKANTSKAAKVKKLWSKWGQRKAEPAEVPVVATSVENPPDRSREEEDLACEAAERILTSTCDDVMDTSIFNAWEATVAESFVGHLKSNTSKAAKVKQLWQTWSMHATEQAEAEEVQRLAQKGEKIASEAVERVLDALFTELLHKHVAELARAQESNRLALVGESMADKAVERVFDRLFFELLDTSILSAWASSITGSYVGHLKTNATKAAKAKRLWEKWSHHGADQAKAERQQAEAVEQLADEAITRLSDLICGELLATSIARALEASVAESYVHHLKANTTKAAKARKLWETWSHHGIEQAKAEQRVELIEPPPPIPQEVKPNPRSPPPPSQAQPLRDHRPDVCSPETAEPLGSELLAHTESRAVAVTPELPTATRDLAVRQSNGSRCHDDDDNNEMDDSTRDWRGRLRLLKQHQRARRHASPKRTILPTGRSTVVVAPRPLAGPVLLDRSSLVLDIDDPSSLSGQLSSLRAPRRAPVSIDDDDDDGVLVTTTALPEWRRDGSFRSFHAFFNATPATSTPIRQPQSVGRSSQKYASAPSPALPKMALGSPNGMTSYASPPPPSSSLPGASTALRSDVRGSETSPAPTKRLPYLRRRK